MSRELVRRVTAKVGAVAQSLQTPATEAARLWEGADDWLVIDRCQGLELGVDVAAERAYGAMADHAGWSSPWASLRLIIAALPFPLAVAASNVAHRLGLATSAPAHPTVLLLQGRPRL